MINELFFRLIKKILNSRNYDITHKIANNNISTEFPPDFEKKNINIIKKVENYTMTSVERLNSLINAVKYVIDNNIEGSFVECGVWKGGSVMSMALTLISKGILDRDIYLYDTFKGMPKPKNIDVDVHGTSAENYLSSYQKSEGSLAWCIASKDEVKKNIYNTGYPKENFKLIEGKVEDKIPRYLPGKISILRLDTDWYESTKHTMIHLYPLLAENGILIIDDYGHWKGSKKAVDEYIGENNICIFLQRIDKTGRIAIKSKKN